MIELKCQVRELVEKLTMLSKVKMGSKKNFASLACRIPFAGCCELCLSEKVHRNNNYMYSDYYAYIDLQECVGQGMFVFPDFTAVLTALKTLDKNDLVLMKYDKDVIKIIFGEDVIYENYSSEPDDSYIKILNTFEFEIGVNLSSRCFDYISDLLTVIPPTKKLSDTFFNSVVFDKHPIKSNCLLLMRTDSMRLMYYDVPLEFEWPLGGVVVPRDVIAWLSKLKKKSSEAVIMKQHGDYISFEYDAYRLVCGIEKTFPPVIDFIKLDVDCNVTLVTEPLIKAVEYVTLGDINRAITIKAKNQEAVVYSYDDEARKRSLNCELNSDKEFELSIVSQFLLSILKKCGYQVSISRLLSNNFYKITSPYKDFYYVVGCCKKNY